MDGSESTPMQVDRKSISPIRKSGNIPRNQHAENVPHSPQSNKSNNNSDLRNSIDARNKEKEKDKGRVKEKDKELDRDQGEKILEKGKEKEKEKDKEREKERDKDRKINGISSKDKSNETETAAVKNKSVSQQDKESLLHAESFRKEGG